MYYFTAVVSPLIKLMDKDTGTFKTLLYNVSVNNETI
jgi:hypothetical protein